MRKPERRVHGATPTKVEPTTGIDCSPIDPEGWMAERPTYWLDLPEPERPTRLAWLRHRARECASWLELAERKAEPRPSEEEWIRLSETALGPLPRPAKKAGQKPRSALPNARNSARKPAAYSLGRFAPR